MKPHLSVVRSEHREPEVIVSGDFIVELEDITRWPWGEPSLAEWLALPTGPACPACGGTYWGTRNPRGYLHVRSCHGDADRDSCGTWFRTDDEHELAVTALDLWARALGYRQRFVMRRATPEEIASGQVIA